MDTIICLLSFKLEGNVATKCHYLKTKNTGCILNCFRWTVDSGYDLSVSQRFCFKGFCACCLTFFLWGTLTGFDTASLILGLNV